MSQKEHFIQQFDLSGSLPQEILTSLQFRHVEKAEYLCHQGDELESCHQGDELESFYFLVHGKVQVDAFHLDGKQAVFSFETPLAIIGDVELLEHKAVIPRLLGDEETSEVMRRDFAAGMSTDGTKRITLTEYEMLGTG